MGENVGQRKGGVLLVLLTVNGGAGGGGGGVLMKRTSYLSSRDSVSVITFGWVLIWRELRKDLIFFNSYMFLFLFDTHRKTQFSKS